VNAITLQLLETNSVAHINEETDEHFTIGIVKLVHYKITVTCVYRNPNSNIQITLDRLQTILDFIDKMKDQFIIMGNLNINFLKSDRNKEKPEVLLNMFGLQAVINEPDRIHKKTKSAIDQIILNPKLWGFKTEVLETSLSDHLDKYFK
jgi:hypothetical protein